MTVAELKKVLETQQDCTEVFVTNGDNLYSLNGNFKASKGSIDLETHTHSQSLQEIASSIQSGE